MAHLGDLMMRLVCNGETLDGEATVTAAEGKGHRATHFHLHTPGSQGRICEARS